MSQREQIKAAAMELAMDEQATGLTCPFCEGGASKERSLSVIRQATKASYCCHRASCGMTGSVRMTAEVGEAVQPKKKPTAYTFNLTAIPMDAITRLSGVISSLDLKNENMLWAPHFDGGRLAMPIKGRFGNRNGYVFRTLDKAVKPKTITILTNPDQSCMSWYSKQDDRYGNWQKKDVLLVEDIFSAIKARKHIHSIALLGTNLSSEKIAEIYKIRPTRLIIALDEDATAKSAKKVAELSGIFDCVEMLALKKDIKDCTDEEIELLLKRE